MNDPLVRGATAGVIGQVVITFITVPSKYLFHFSRYIWAEYVSALIFGHPPRNLGEWMASGATLLALSGLIGAGFRFSLAVFPNRRNYLLRGIGWANLVWISTFATGTLFKMALFLKRDWKTDIVQFLASAAFGLVVGLLTQRWDKVYGYPETLVSQKASSPENMDSRATSPEGLSNGEQAGQKPLAGLASTEAVDALGRIESILGVIADRLDRRPEESSGGDQETGWDSVEHLGFRVLKPSGGEESPR